MIGLAPAFRQRHPGQVMASMAYSNSLRRLVLLRFRAGSSAPFFTDTWVWDGVNWRQQFPAVLRAACTGDGHDPRIRCHPVRWARSGRLCSCKRHLETGVGSWPPVARRQHRGPWLTQQFVTAYEGNRKATLVTVQPCGFHLRCDCGYGCWLRSITEGVAISWGSRGRCNGSRSDELFNVRSK
jgi:hypothetical protein